MTRLQEWLKDGDPVAGEPPLSDPDVRRMRRDVIAAEEDREPGFMAGRRAPLAAAMVILAAATIGVVSWRGPVGESIEIGSPGRGTAGQPVTRQLIFETPGGTRVIWVFNPEFRE